MCLAFHIGEIGAGVVLRYRSFAARGHEFATREMRANFQQVASGKNSGAFDQCRFRCVLVRHHERAAIAARAAHHRQRAAYRAQLSRQRKLAREFIIGEIASGHLAGRREYAQRNRQVEAPAFFRQIGRRQINGDVPRRKFEARILQCGAYAVFRLFDFRFGQANDGKTRQPVGEMGLDRDERCVHSCQRAAV